MRGLKVFEGFEGFLLFLSFLFEEIPIILKLEFYYANLDQIRNKRPQLYKNIKLYQHQTTLRIFRPKTAPFPNNVSILLNIP